MAKSLRSKWRRKCRAVKRVRYGQKELERLKKTLGIDDTKTGDVNMDELNEVATVVDSEHIKEQQNEGGEESGDDEDMDTDKVDKSMRDEKGRYPIWLHPRKRGKKSGKAKIAERNKSTWRIQKKKTRSQKKNDRNKKK